MIGMGVVEPFVGRIEFVEVFKGMITYLMEGRAVVDQFPFLEYGYHELLQLEVCRISLLDMGDHGVVHL